MLLNTKELAILRTKLLIQSSAQIICVKLWRFVTEIYLKNLMNSHVLSASKYSETEIVMFVVAAHRTRLQLAFRI